MSEQPPLSGEPAPGWPPAPPPGAPIFEQQQAWPPPPPPPPVGKGAGLVVVIIAGVVILGLLGVAALFLVGRTGSSGQSSTGSSSTALSSPTSAPRVATTSDTAGATTSTPAQGVARPEVPSGFKLVADDERGFAFVMPTTWTSTQLTPEQVQAMADRLRASNPNLAAALEQFKTFASSGGRAFAFGKPAGSTTPTLNLLELPSGGLTLDQIAGQVELGLGSVNAKVTSKAKLKVGGRDALEIVLELTVPGVGTVAQKQVYVARDSMVFVFTVASGDPATTDTILHSLRVR